MKHRNKTKPYSVRRWASFLFKKEIWLIADVLRWSWRGSKYFTMSDRVVCKWSQSLLWSATVSSSRSRNPRTPSRVRHKISLCCAPVWFSEYRNFAIFLTQPLLSAERFWFFPWLKQYLRCLKFKVHREVKITVTWCWSHRACNDIHREHKVWQNGAIKGAVVPGTMWKVYLNLDCLCWRRI